MRALGRAWESDLAWELRHSPAALAALVVALLCLLGAVCAPLIAPQDPFDLASLELWDSLLPPSWCV